MKSRCLDPRKFLVALFETAVSAAAPERVVPLNLPTKPKGRTVVVGAGKAAAAMAKAVEDHWDAPLEGLVVTRFGHSVPCDQIRVIEASHPVRGEAGVSATRQILRLAKSAGEADLVLCLLSGGGSALLTLPAPGISISDKQQINKALLASGATITEMNTVRKHLSAIKGGQLALAAWPAQVATLVISDVPGDDVSVVASGPTVPDYTTRGEARTLLLRYGIQPPASVTSLLDGSDRGSQRASYLPWSHTTIVASSAGSLEAAARLAKSYRVTPIILGDFIEGEAREVGRVLAGIASSIRRHSTPVAPPAVILSGGETTVTLKTGGHGGRNTEFLAGFALAANGTPGVFALAADTDGIDGTEENAGAFVTPSTLARLRLLGIDLHRKLDKHETYAPFRLLGDLIVTGPTLTNVNDFRAILVE